MITKTNSLNNINEITLTNLENGEVTLEQLNEIYNKSIKFHYKKIYRWCKYCLKSLKICVKNKTLP